jgi:hypothetical protein
MNSAWSDAAAGPLRPARRQRYAQFPDTGGSTPERVILLFDQLLDPRKGYGGNTMNRSAGRNCGSYPKAFSACHARSAGALGGFLLYCDSHVTWKQTVWKDQWPPVADFEAPPRNDPDWYPY